LGGRKDICPKLLPLILRAFLPQQVEEVPKKEPADPGSPSKTSKAKAVKWK